MGPLLNRVAIPFRPTGRTRVRHPVPLRLRGYFARNLPNARSQAIPGRGRCGADSGCRRRLCRWFSRTTSHTPRIAWVIGWANKYGSGSGRGDQRQAGARGVKPRGVAAGRPYSWWRGGASAHRIPRPGCCYDRPGCFSFGVWDAEGPRWTSPFHRGLFVSAAGRGADIVAARRGLVGPDVSA